MKRHNTGDWCYGCKFDIPPKTRGAGFNCHFCKLDDMKCSDYETGDPEAQRRIQIVASNVGDSEVEYIRAAGRDKGIDVQVVKQ